MSPIPGQDFDGGRAFFRRGRYFVCTLAPPRPDDVRGNAVLAFAIAATADRDAYREALEFARHAVGRHHAMVLERVSLGTEHWPTSEPPPALHYVVERDGYVVLAPSVTSWVHMPPAQPHLLVQLVAATPRAGETEARAALAKLGTCGMVTRVCAVLQGDSGAELDAVVSDAGGLRGGWFAPSPEPAGAASPGTGVDSVATPAPAAVAANKPALDPAVTASASDFLWAQQPCVVWSDEFVLRYQQHLLSRHPGLTPADLAALLAYGRWLCWHEGLGKP